MISYRNKIVSLETLLPILEDTRVEKKQVVFTNGCFDILHLGHVDYLEKAKGLGDVLVVGLNSDDSVRQLKGPFRPINTLQNRAGVLAGLQSVDYVVEFSDGTPLELIKVVKPDVLVKGGDWDVNQIVGAPEVLSQGGKVLSLPLVEGLSTTNIENKIKNDNQND